MSTDEQTAGIADQKQEQVEQSVSAGEDAGQQQEQDQAAEEHMIERESKRWFYDRYETFSHADLYLFARVRLAVKPVIIRLPTPSYPQTLPKTGEKKQTPTPSTFVIHPQPGETIQDIRATLLEWTGGYWLGPYSLRIPRAKKSGSKDEKDQDLAGRGRLLGKGKEGVEIREGEKLSDWFEMGEVFGHLEGTDVERVLVVQRGESGSSRDRAFRRSWSRC